MSKPAFVTFDKFKDVMRGIDLLTKSKVYVGIPLDKATRSGEDLSNAELGYIHENGAPEANIPARPFLVPGVREAQTEISARFKVMAKRATDLTTGGTAQVKAALDTIGLIAANAVKRKISFGPFEPLADSTLRARASSGKGKKGAKAELASRAEGNAPGTALARPLIHTAQMRNAVTSVVRDVK